MIDSLITGLVILIIFASSLIGIKIEKQNEVFSLSNGALIRGICSIIVFFVHIPEMYGNRTQSTIGSLAFVCVTLFCVLSGYGLIKQKLIDNQYNKHFWRNRLLSLLIPQIIVNVFLSILLLDYSRLYKVDSFILMMIVCYMIYYFIYGISKKAGGKTLLFFTLAIVFFCVLMALFEPIIPFTIWPVPCLGVALGAGIAQFEKKIIKIVSEKWWIFAVVTIVISIVSLMAYAQLDKSNLIIQNLYRIPVIILCISTVVVFSSNFKIKNALTTFLGSISFLVYLIHGGIIYFFSNYFVPLRSSVFIVTCLLTTIIIGTICFYLSKYIIKRYRK